MSQTYCKNSSSSVEVFAMAMIAIIAIVAIGANDNDEPISPQERQARDQAWQESQTDAINTLNQYKLPLGLVGLMLGGLILKKAYDSRNYQLFAALLLLGGLSGMWFYYDGDFGSFQLGNLIPYPIQTGFNGESYIGHLSGVSDQ